MKSRFVSVLAAVTAVLIPQFVFADHAHVPVDSFNTKVEMQLYNRGIAVADVSFVATPSEDETQPDEYMVIIKRHGNGEAPFSLYSLGVQGRRNDIEILTVSGDSVRFFDHDERMQWGGENEKRPFPWRIPNAGSKLFNSAAKDKRVWFIEFKGDTCTLKVRALRSYKGRPGKIGAEPPHQKSMHDTFPRNGIPGAYN